MSIPIPEDPSAVGSLPLLLLYVGGALFFSFLCSVLEATLLSSRVVELVDRKAAGDQGAAKLLTIKQQRLDDAISAILTINTIAHTVGSTLAGAEAAKLFESKWMGLFTFVFTMMVLMFTEIIPKTLGAVYASRLVGFVARTTSLMMWVLHVPLMLTGLLTRLISGNRQMHTSVSRSELSAMVAMAASQGTLPAAESLVVNNVLQYHQIKVEDVMTPRTVIAMLPIDTTIEQFLVDEESRVFSRIPLFEGNHDNVSGYVLQREVLSAAAHGRDQQIELSEFLRKALYVPEGQPVGRVLRRLLETREHLALVTDEYGGISGLVTLEDLMETTLGIEIVDESDRVTDLRAEALRKREKRLESLRKWRLEVDEGTPSAEDSGSD